MSVELVRDNPNRLSPTFRGVAVNMGDFKKVVIPKGHKIAKHVPIADLVLNSKDVFDRVELAQDENGDVTYTVCLNPKITGGQKDFKLTLDQENEIGTLITQVQNFLEYNNPSDCGGGAFHVGCLNAHFPVTETVDRSKLVGDKAELGALYDVTLGVITPMAARHGGSFEIVDIYGANEAPLNNAEQRFLTESKTSIGFELIVFGSCSGCTAFNLTYGQAPREIAESVDSNSTMQVRQITQKEAEKAGGVMGFLGKKEPKALILK